MLIPFTDKSMCIVVTLANYEWFSQWKDARVMKRGAEYDAIKNAIGQRMWDQTLHLFPQLEDKVRAHAVNSIITKSLFLDHLTSS